MNALFARRVPCNEALAEHPTVQVARGAKGYNVGVLGLINGLFGVDTEAWGHIAAVVGDQGIIRFVSRATHKPDA